jgi:hypothetical protein
MIITPKMNIRIAPTHHYTIANFIEGDHKILVIH